MSSTILFILKDKMEYKKIKELSIALVNHCVKIDKGIHFYPMYLYSDNSADYFNKFLNFSISDDFLSVNSEFLNVCDIMSIESDVGRKQFNEKFCFLDKIFDIILDFGCKKISLVVFQNEVGDFNNYEKELKGSRSYCEILYNHIIRNKEKYAYSFSEIIINNC